MQDLLENKTPAVGAENICGHSLDEETATAVLQSAGHGLIVSIGTDRGGRITYVNEAFEAMTGWKASEVLGKDLVEAMPRQGRNGEPVPYEDQIMTSILDGEKVVADLYDPFYFVRRDKTKFPVASIISPLRLDNQIIGTVETFRDITKESAADKVKTEFASLVSHQLRTPFSTINWYIELLLSGDAGKLSPKQTDYLNEVYQASKRMVDLDNLLLNSSRIEMGLSTGDTEQVNIVSLAEVILKERRLESRQKKLTIRKKFDKNIPLIRADSKQLFMIFQNLLSNAIKYTPQGGKITLGIACKKSIVSITVADTGIGIPEGDQSKIFSRFFRAENAKAEQQEGVGGLGLYILKAIVDQMDGKIWFESQEHRGTTFHITFPLKPKDAVHA